MDEVKFGGWLECFGDVEVFGYFGIDAGILFVTLVHYGMKAGASQHPAGERSHIPARATSPSVMLLATVSQAPYCRGGVRQATGERIATLFLGLVILFDANSFFVNRSLLPKARSA